MTDINILMNSDQEYVLRQRVRGFTKGLVDLDVKTLRNYDTLGVGIKGKITIGNKVFYPANEIWAFVESRMKGGAQ